MLLSARWHVGDWRLHETLAVYCWNVQGRVIPSTPRHEAMWCTCSVIMLHRVSRHWGQFARRLDKDMMMHMQHEAALTKAEATLEEDSAAFDKFLKESDEKVQQAMARADAEMRAKQEKVSSGHVMTSMTGHLTRESTRP